MTYDDRITGMVGGWIWSFEYQRNRRNAFRNDVVLAATGNSHRWVGLFPVENQNVGDPEGDSLMFRFLGWTDMPQFVNLYTSNPLVVEEKPLLSRGVRIVYGPRPVILLQPSPGSSYRFALFDVAGRRTWEVRLAPPYGEGVLRLAPPPLSAGIYLLRVHRDEELLGRTKILLR